MNLNLLPWREIRRTKTKKQLLQAASLLVVLVTVAMIFGQYVTRQRMNQQIYYNQQLEKEIARLDELSRTGEKLSKIRTNLCNKISTIHHIQMATNGLARILGDLTTMLPAKAYLGQIKCEGEHLSLLGFSQASQSSIFIARLSQHPCIHHLAIEQIKKSPSGLYSEFYLSFYLKGCT